VDVVEELRYLVLAAQREGARALAEVLRPLGLTPAQAEVLTVLRTASGALSVREIGERLVCETGSPSRLVTSLVTAGLVDGGRDPADGRITRLGLTATGRRVAAQAHAAEHDFHRGLAAGLPHGQALDVVVEFLRELVATSPSGRALSRRRAQVDAPQEPAHPADDVVGA
jgi:DNA-binding MarR family transcriptional regulator